MQSLARGGLLDLEREEEYAELCKPSEVKEYTLDAKEILKKYGEVSKEKRNRTFSFGEGVRVKTKEGESVVFGVDRVKTDILEGLTKKDIFEKYDAANNLKSRFFNIAIKQLLESEQITEDQAEKARKSEKEEVAEVEEETTAEVFEEEVFEFEREAEEIEKESNTNTLAVESMSLTGKVASYKISNKTVQLIRGTQHIALDKYKIGELINELEELKNYVR